MASPQRLTAACLIQAAAGADLTLEQVMQLQKVTWQIVLHSNKIPKDYRLILRFLEREDAVKDSEVILRELGSFYNKVQKLVDNDEIVGCAAGLMVELLPSCGMFVDVFYEYCLDIAKKFMIDVYPLLSICNKDIVKKFRQDYPDCREAEEI